MTIALQRSNNDTVFFDAVLSFNQSYQSKLTSHPIDGANVKDGINVANDHVVTENPSFSIKGVFSTVDFNTGRPVSSELQIKNNNAVDTAVRVVKVQDSLLEMVGSLLLPVGNNVAPEVELSDRQTNTLDQVKEFLINARNNRETLTLVEFTAGSEIGSPVKDLVITNLQFNEDADSGGVLNVDIALQQANFVKLVTTTVHPRSVSADVQSKAAPEAYKGPMARLENTTVLQDIKSTIGNSITDLVDSFKNRDGQSVPKALKVLKDAGVLPQ